MKIIEYCTGCGIGLTSWKDKIYPCEKCGEIQIQDEDHLNRCLDIIIKWNIPFSDKIDFDKLEKTRAILLSRQLLDYVI